MRACAVGVMGRGAAVEVRRQCSTSVDDISTAPPCGRDAATHGAEFEAGRHGGSAEFEAAAPTLPGTIVHDRGAAVLIGGPFVWEPSSSQDARTLSQDAGQYQATTRRLVT